MTEKTSEIQNCSDCKQVIADDNSAFCIICLKTLSSECCEELDTHEIEHYKNSICMYCKMCLEKKVRRCELCLEIYFEEEKTLAYCCFCDKVICDKCIDEHFTSGENLCDKYDWEARFHILDIKQLN